MVTETHPNDDWSGLGPTGWLDRERMTTVNNRRLFANVTSGLHVEGSLFCSSPRHVITARLQTVDKSNWERLVYTSAVNIK